MQSTEGGRPVPPFPSSPFLIGYVVVDTMKRSQESARRRGRKGGAQKLPRLPLLYPKFPRNPAAYSMAYCKSSVRSHGGAYFRGWGAYLIQKRRWYKFQINNWNTKWKSSSTRRLEVMQPRIGIKSELPSGLVNKPFRISPNEVLQS